MTTPEQTAPTLVQVPHTLWIITGDVASIAEPLRAGHTVEMMCKVSWCKLASHGQARMIQQALRDDYGLRVQFTTAYRSDAGRWFITFTLE